MNLYYDVQTYFAEVDEHFRLNVNSSVAENCWHTIYQVLKYELYKMFTYCKKGYIIISTENSTLFNETVCPKWTFAKYVPSKMVDFVSSSEQTFWLPSEWADKTAVQTADKNITIIQK